MADDTRDAGTTFKRIGRGVFPVDGEGAKALVEDDADSNLLQQGQNSVLAVRHSSPNEDIRLKLDSLELSNNGFLVLPPSIRSLFALELAFYFLLFCICARGVMIPTFFGIGIGTTYTSMGVCWIWNHKCWNHVMNWNRF